MPSFLRATCVLSVCALAACASNSTRVAATPDAEIRMQAVDPSKIVTDDVYISRINRDAQRRGLQVQWINPPLRRTRD